MRPTLVSGTLFAVFVLGATPAAAQDKKEIELRAELIVAGLPLAESAKGVYKIRLTAEVDKKGEGNGVLELDPNAPAYDEFGFFTSGASLPAVKLKCTLKFVKKKTLQIPESPRIAAPLRDVDWVIYEIEGPKITSRLTLATEDKQLGRFARLLVHGKDGKVRYSIGMTVPPPPEPCHPGCFPAGTPIRVADGTKPVERIRAGDSVTTIGPDGSASQTKVQSVFVTKNRLIEVRTDGGKLVTTETQPLALADGGLRAAGELKAGDRIVRWDGRQRVTVTVQSVSPTGREELVFNLILGDPALFIADGFLVRSKPPAPDAPAPAAARGVEAPAGRGKE